MAKQSKVLPARKPREEDSLLIRSAESLGRMIGTLQRQLDDASRKLSPRPFVPDATADGDGHAKSATVSVRTPGRAAQAKKSPSKSGATKIRSTADRKSKRASKSAAAKKSAGRTRSGASRKNRKAARRR